MAYDEKPHSAAYGTRYSDDSGWERLVEVDHHTDTLRIEIGGSNLSCSVADMEWIENALRTVRYATKPLQREEPV